MSLLNDLCAKRTKLKPTTTLVTHPDGRKFKEFGSDIPVEIARADYGFVVDSKPDNIPAKIVDFVYLGSQDCCESTVLTDYQIGYVLSVGIEAPTKYDNIVYKFVQCLDLPSTDLENVFAECMTFMGLATESRRNLLVHCNAGVSRSATVAIGYLILVRHYNYSDAYELVKKARTCIRPNDGFLKQLNMLTINHSH